MSIFRINKYSLIKVLGTYLLVAFGIALDIPLIMGYLPIKYLRFKSSLATSAVIAITLLRLQK